MQLVLVVDDEPAIRSTLALLLRAAGYKVRTAESAAAALRAAASFCPDFLITDINMPGMTGAELVYQLRPRFRAAG